jgi:MHS family proline/betaine transporter-like MFS transporter
MATSSHIGERGGASAPLTFPEARRAVVGGAIGNILEQYDNVIYAYSAVTLAPLFFPKSSGTVALLATFAVFAVGFVIRPVGALYFGHMGDRLGRRRALVLSVTLMAFGTTLVGVLPTYSSIGVLAPIALVVLRLVQGFSVGGEWAGSTTFIVEYAPPERRGLYGSWQQVSTAVGFLLAAGVSTVVTLSFSSEAMHAWAWRLPFLFAIVTGVAALWVRLRLDETPKFLQAEHAHNVVDNPLVESLRRSWRGILRGFGFTILWTLAYFLFLTYLPTFLVEQAHLSPGMAKLSNTFSLVVFAILIPFAGLLSDRVGRKPLLLAATGGFIVLSYPIMLLLSTGNLFLIYAAEALLALLLATFSGPGPAALAEMFETEVRYSALSIGYNLSAAAFGGTAPFLAILIISGTGSKTSPALLAIGAALITLLTVVTMRETSRLPLR